MPIVQIAGDWRDDGSQVRNIVPRKARLAWGPPPSPAASSTPAVGTQIADCRLGVARVAVINPGAQKLTEAERRVAVERIQSAWGPVTRALVLDTANGRCELDAAFLQTATEQEHAALACSVVQASWGWDESERIAVKIGATTLLVQARFSGSWNQWEAEIIEAGD